MLIAVAFLNKKKFTISSYLRPFTRAEGARVLKSRRPGLEPPPSQWSAVRCWKLLGPLTLFSYLSPYLYLDYLKRLWGEWMQNVCETPAVTSVSFFIYHLYFTNIDL